MPEVRHRWEAITIIVGRFDICILSCISCLVSVPSVYTRISYFYDWIQETACTNFPNDVPSYMNCISILGIDTDEPTIELTNEPTMAPTDPSEAPSPVPPDLSIISVASNSTMTPTEVGGLHKVEYLGWNPELPLKICQGDCDLDSDCEGSLKCFQREGVLDKVTVPGCGDISNIPVAADICYDPSVLNITSP